MKKATFSALTVAFGLLVGGCTVVPGMHMDKTSAAAAGGPYQARSAQIEGVEVIPITPLLVEQMREADTRPAAAKDEQWVYRIGPQDVLRIMVWGHPDLSATMMTNVVQGAQTSTSQVSGRVVQANGELFMPLVGNIQAAGLTVPEFRSRLSNALAKFIKEPQVEVDVAGFRSQRVAMTGEVRTPGVVPLTDVPLRLSRALAQVGGATPAADLERVVLVRGDQRYEINAYAMLYEGDLRSDMLLRDGDLITVPDQQSRKVFVIGEVNSSRSQVMRRGHMSLTEVISDAGGASQFSAAANEVFVLRQGPDGKPLIYQIDARNPDALVLADSFKVRPRDVVFVNPTDIVRIGRTLSQFFPVTSGVANLQTLNNNF